MALRMLQSYQPDWEAILSDSPRPFIHSLSQWLYPKAVSAATAPGAGPCDADASAEQSAVDRLPAVKELLSTMRSRLEALNGLDAERIHAQ